MIRAFLFDNGGVITRGGAGNELSERLAVNLGISGKQAWELLSPGWGDYMRGAITEAELWAIAEKQYGKAIAPAERAIWDKWADMQPLLEMIDLVQGLRQKGYIVGMLSNVIPSTAQEVRSHGGYDVFDPLILSCEAGYAKPEPQIYELALQRLGNVSPAEVVFLDDQERFLAPAREMGMQTILVTSPEQAIGDVGRLLGTTT